MPLEHDIELLRSHWQVEEAPAALASRIVAHARMQPQRQPWSQRVSCFFGQWDYAIAPKAMVFAAVALIGLYAGQLSLQADDDFDLSAWTGIDSNLTEDL